MRELGTDGEVVLLGKQSNECSLLEMGEKSRSELVY